MPSVVTVTVTVARRSRGFAALLGWAVALAFAGAVAASAPTLASPVTTPDLLPSVRREAEPVLSVTSVALNRSRVAVSGLNTMPVRVTVTGSYPSPAQEGDDLTSLTAILTRSPSAKWPALSALAVPLTRVGTVQTPGTWTGVANIPSTLHGVLKVTQVTTEPAHIDTGGTNRPVAVTGPSLQVTGVHQPSVSAAGVPRRPAPTIRSYAITGKVLDSTTKSPYRSRVTVELVLDGLCWSSAKCQVRTDRRGRFTFRIANTPIGSPPTRPVMWSHNVLLQSAAKDAMGFPTLISIKPVRLR